MSRSRRGSQEYRLRKTFEEDVSKISNHFSTTVKGNGEGGDEEEEETSSGGITEVKGVFAGVSFPVLALSIVGGLITIFIFIACLISALHRVSEGHVGVYYRNGALLDEMSEPGVHWAQPFVTSVVEIRVTPETKVLHPMICTTRDGVRNVFRDVQVITSIDRNQVINIIREFTTEFKKILIYERVIEAVQKFCANNSIDEVYNSRFLEIQVYVNSSLLESLKKFAPNYGLKVWNIFLPKPDVPPAIAANYRQVKIEWTQQLVAQQRQKTETIRKETEKIKAILDAERKMAVQMIDVKNMIQIEEGKKNVTRISSESWEEQQRIEADTTSYVQGQEAKSNQLLLTDQYIKLQLIKSLMNNTKMYFSGQDSLLGRLLGQLLPNNN